jgi:hypothetical protein
MWCDWPRPFVHAVIAKRPDYATANCMGAIVTVIAIISRVQAFRAKITGNPSARAGREDGSSGRGNQAGALFRY